MKTVVVLVVLAGVGIGAFLLLGGRDFGVDGKNPLGTWEEIRGWLVEREMKPRPMERREAAAVLGEELAGREDVTITRFDDFIPNFQAFVAVARDRSDRVVGVGGVTQSKLLEYSTVGARSVAFLAHYWVAVTGEEPIFRDEAYGANEGQVRSVARHRGPGVEASWIKDWGGGLALAYNVADRFALTVR